MVDIKCLACGKAVKIPQFINTENYDGQVVCQGCKSLLYIKLVKEKAERYKIVKNKFEGTGGKDIVKNQIPELMKMLAMRKAEIEAETQAILEEQKLSKEEKPIIDDKGDKFKKS